jgi:hypothetical protein
MNEAYYKIYVTENNVLVPVCLQDFDEHDYSAANWFSSYKFKTEEEALNMIGAIYAYIGKYL